MSIPCMKSIHVQVVTLSPHVTCMHTIVQHRDMRIARCTFCVKASFRYMQVLELLRLITVLRSRNGLAVALQIYAAVKRKVKSA
jgi:hypothetical protein